MLFAGSTEGAHRACVLLGIVATCPAVGVPVQAYLTWAFERLGTHRDVFGLRLEEMTPAAFKKTLGRHAGAPRESRGGTTCIPASLIAHSAADTGLAAGLRGGPDPEDCAKGRRG